MSDRRVILIGGGVHSGKSAFAVGLARRLGPRRAFVATAQPLDDEMRDRIALHIAERGGDFTTLEEPLAVPAAVARLSDIDVVVIDCLTLWLSNLLLGDRSAERILAQVDELAAVVTGKPFHSILVTNEVGMGVVPESALGRAFRDLVGRAHQRLVRSADEIYFAVLGVILRIQPGPVAVQPFRDAR